MRSAVLHLLFAGLGAERALTAAFTDNPSSHAVTTKLGYEENGRHVVERRPGEPATRVDFVLTRSRWERQRRDDIEVSGLDGCLTMFGLQAPSAEPTSSR